MIDENFDSAVGVKYASLFPLRKGQALFNHIAEKYELSNHVCTENKLTDFPYANFPAVLKSIPDNEFEAALQNG